MYLHAQETSYDTRRAVRLSKARAEFAGFSNRSNGIPLACEGNWLERSRGLPQSSSGRCGDGEPRSEISHFEFFSAGGPGVGSLWDRDEDLLQLSGRRNPPLGWPGARPLLDPIFGPVKLCLTPRNPAVGQNGTSTGSPRPTGSSCRMREAPGQGAHVVVWLELSWNGNGPPSQLV